MEEPTPFHFPVCIVTVGTTTDASGNIIKYGKPLYVETDDGPMLAIFNDPSVAMEYAKATAGIPGQVGIIENAAALYNFVRIGLSPAITGAVHNPVVGRIEDVRVFDLKLFAEWFDRTYGTDMSN